MEEKRKNVKSNKQEESVVVRSDRSRNYLQRSQTGQTHGIVLFANITRAVKIEVSSGYG